HPKELQTILKDIKENTNHLIINTLLLRSMMKAKYDFSNLGHYGLAMNYYCHFTSPIRRYPDLMVHRLIKNLLLHPKELEHDMKHYQAILPEVCMKTSAAERRSIDCERAVNDMLYAWYMQSHIHEEFKGIISSITPFGMFVLIDDGVEGLVSFREMNGYFEYNENTMSASNGQVTYHLGDKVDVVLEYASKETRRIDFLLKEDYERLY
ncbi:MAG: RNB domain-containing ribonuclease, partial [Gammaproteobacteria bacterium]|nr:RNB domain-containing ribonuclease [Gammaproteobacteria bacterium]